MRKPGDGKADEELAALVGVFSHSAVNNDEFKDIQTESLEEGFDNVLELIRCNDTRGSSPNY